MTRDAAVDGYILSIVAGGDVREQAQLLQLLRERGHDVPQATLSRRLKKLKIAKVGGAYRLVDFPAMHLPVVLNVQVSDYGLIVLHTQPGNASGLAYFFDQKYVSYSPQKTSDGGILGTVAGDDTVLLVLKSKDSLQSVLEVLWREFPYLKDVQ